MRRWVAILAAVPLLVGGATTAPSTTPVPPPVAAWFAELGDPDPAVRDRAREDLMGLSTDFLPALRAAVAAGRPVRPGQAAVLHEVVCQIVLTSEPYEVEDGTHYIMGQNWPSAVRVGERVGVPVVDRWPGFPARRWLRDGDLILGLYADPGAPLGQPPDLATHYVHELVYGMRECPSLPRLAMSVLRDGRVIRVTATLAAEPAQTVGRFPVAVATFLADRQRRADAYWDAQFAPLVPTPAADPLDGTGR